MRYFKLPDGSVQFIARGLPPEELSGYVVDEHDPYIFHPILPPCAARVYKDLPGKECCHAAKNVRHCTKYGYIAMTAETCFSCAAQNMHIELNTTKLKT